MEPTDQTPSNTASDNLEVISMVIWLSTGNGKFFELVRFSFLALCSLMRVLLSSTALVTLSSKSYLTHQRRHFVGVIIILQLIPNGNLTLKFLKHFSKLVFVSKVHPVPVLRVFFVLNTFSSVVNLPKPGKDEETVWSEIGFCTPKTVLHLVCFLCI